VRAADTFVNPADEIRGDAEDVGRLQITRVPIVHDVGEEDRREDGKWIEEIDRRGPLGGLYEEEIVGR